MAAKGHPSALRETAPRKKFEQLQLSLCATILLFRHGYRVWDIQRRG
jgi:hypothetical protein